MYACIDCFPARCSCHSPTSTVTVTETRKLTIDDLREEILLRHVIGEYSDTQAEQLLAALAA